MVPLSNSGPHPATRTRTQILRTSSTTPNSQLGNGTPRARDVVEGQTTSVGHSSCGPDTRIYFADQVRETVRCCGLLNQRRLAWVSLPAPPSSCPQTLP